MQQAKEWVEEINVQKYVTNYSCEVFLGGATDRDAFVEEEKQDGIVEIEENQGEKNEYDESDEEDSYYLPDETVHQNELNEGDCPDLSDLVPKSFSSVWDISPDRSSTAEETPSPTEVSSKRYVRSDLSAFLEPWLLDLFDRTLEGQMEETTFVGGAEDGPFEVLCSLCRSSVGDQHVVRCQYAHDEQERMAALWTG